MAARPTLLPAADLAAVLGGIRDRFGLAFGAEVTTEANPDSVSAESLIALADGRLHPGQLRDAERGAPRPADPRPDPRPGQRRPRRRLGPEPPGLDVSLDLIYGTPGESLDDWRRSLDTAVALEPDHVSAYALVVEEGTRLAVQVRRGEVPAPEDDDEADKYELADEVLTAAGYELVRGEQLGAVAGAAVPPQRGVLGRR